jgi:hypothetical protein
MGGSSSKPAEVKPAASTFTPDLSKFTVTGDYAVELQRKAEEAAAAGKAALDAQMAAASSASWWTNVKWGAALVATIIVMTGIGYLIWYILFKTGVTNKNPADPNVYKGLHGTNDITQSLVGMIQNGTLNIKPSLSATLGGISGKPLSSTDSLVITYQFPGDPKPLTATFSDTDEVNISQTSKPGTTDDGSPAPPSTQQATPPSQPGFFARLWGSVTGGSSGDLLGSIHDATTTTSVSGSNAPLSSEGDGAYGMQWWMFVKDWNYGYGKDKSVIVRPDPTNTKVMNPSISLHPTDNSLRVSVSVFPSTEGGAAASQPAPAGHSGASDDVFICEVPNIPLQTWFSVSVTVFGRNLDIYIDGKLVKSCFLTGVPKPATGDVQVTPGGGFSGNICNFTHYPRMLTPSDANSFWTAGTSCQKATAPSAATAATGYSVKFGVYDPLGKQVQQYTF